MLQRQKKNYCNNNKNLFIKEKSIVFNVLFILFIQFKKSNVPKKKNILPLIIFFYLYIFDTQYSKRVPAKQSDANKVLYIYATHKLYFIYQKKLLNSLSCHTFTFIIFAPQRICSLHPPHTFIENLLTIFTYEFEFVYWYCIIRSHLMRDSLHFTIWNLFLLLFYKLPCEPLTRSHLIASNNRVRAF